jgi:ribonuclease T2
MSFALPPVGALAAIGLGLSIASCAAALAFEPLEGCFVADQSCPAQSSIHGARNPGSLATEAGRAYPLLGANRAQQASHYQIRLPDAQPTDRWVAVACGHTVPSCAPGAAGPAPGSGAGVPAADYVLAASWQPAFCERHRTTPECRSQTVDRFDALHLALHGLWPEPREKVYCGVSRAERATDEAGRWNELPPVELSEETRADLAVVMPGTRSALQRHEWLKHGTCYGAGPEEYFAEALQLMAELNQSPVRTLLAARIGARVTADELRAAFDQAFGAGAGERVALSCAGGLLTELRIHLQGAIDATTRLADLIAAAAPVGAGCAGGRIDPAGFGP